MRGAREAPAPRDSLNFRRASLLSRNEFESGTFTIVLHATSSFAYVSVIYGANFPFNIFWYIYMVQLLPKTCMLNQVYRLVFGRSTWYWWFLHQGSSERSPKHVICTALCASWRLEYGDRNWSNRPQSASNARADDDRRSNRPTPTHKFSHSAIFHPITPYNFWFFWVSRHRSIILAKKMETFSGRFWEISGNVQKLEFSKTLVDHKNALAFYQEVSGKSSWSFSYRWTQHQ